MPSRADFVTESRATQSADGQNNLGIYIVRHTRSNKKYIEKRVAPMAIRSGDFQREVRNHRQCNPHPNIVTVIHHDFSPHPGYGSVFLQRAELGSLDAVIMRFAQRHQFLSDEGFAWKVLSDISFALTFLATGRSVRDVWTAALSNRRIVRNPEWNSIMHRDLKPSNIFLTWGDASEVRGTWPTMLLGDFGCSFAGSDIRTGDGRGLPATDRRFMPPEGQAYMEEGDVWGLAVVICCLSLMVQEPPELHPLVGRWATPGMAMVLEKCLRPDPRRRAAPDELVLLIKRGSEIWKRGREGMGGGAALPAWALPRQR